MSNHPGLLDIRSLFAYRRHACGYGLALGYLARVLRTEGDIDSRLEAVLVGMR